MNESTENNGNQPETDRWYSHLIVGRFQYTLVGGFILGLILLTVVFPVTGQWGFYVAGVILSFGLGFWQSEMMKRNLDRIAYENSPWRKK